MSKIKPFTVDAFNHIAMRIDRTSAYIAFCDFALASLGRANSVTLDHAAIDRFADAMPADEKPSTRSSYLSPAAWAGPLNEVRVMHQFGAIIGQMGGFFEQQADGTTRKWELEGSGAKAVVAKMADIRKALGDAGEGETRPSKLGPKLTRLFDGTPMQAWRIAAMKEFYAAGAMKKTEQVLRASAPGLKDGQMVVGASLTLDFKTIQNLARAYPVSFGGDPLYKKAALLVLMANSHFAARKAEWLEGQSITLNSIVGADYRIPQGAMTEQLGMIRIDDELRQRIARREVMDINDPDVIKLRLATVLLGDRIARRSGRSISTVDSALITAGRDLAKLP